MFGVECRLDMRSSVQLPIVSGVDGELGLRANRRLAVDMDIHEYE